MPLSGFIAAGAQDAVDQVLQRRLQEETRRAVEQQRQQELQLRREQMAMEQQQQAALQEERLADRKYRQEQTDIATAGRTLQRTAPGPISEATAGILGKDPANVGMVTSRRTIDARPINAPSVLPGTVEPQGPAPRTINLQPRTPAALGGNVQSPLDTSGPQNFSVLEPTPEQAQTQLKKVNLQRIMGDLANAGDEATRRKIFARAVGEGVGEDVPGALIGPTQTELEATRARQLNESRTYERGEFDRRHAVSQADLENSKGLAMSLVDGTAVPSMLSKRGNFNNILAEANRLSMQQTGKPYNAVRAQTEYAAAQRFMAAMNGNQQMRFRALASTVVNTIDEVKALSQEMANSGVPMANRLKLMQYAETQGNSPQGQLAARYIGAVNTLTEEFANLANGGYAPTEAAWHLANQQIRSDFGVKQMDAALTEVQRLINYRMGAFESLTPYGVSQNNPVAEGLGGDGSGGHGAAPAAGPKPGQRVRNKKTGVVSIVQPDGTLKPEPVPR